MPYRCVARRWLPPISCLSCLLIQLLCCSASVEAETLEVPGDYLTIQEAIDASVDGDVVEVAAGLYYENIDFGGRTITLRGIDGAEQTVIDGSKLTRGEDYGSVITLSGGEGEGTTIEGLSIENGDGTRITTGAGEVVNIGGGILALGDWVTVRECILSNNDGSAIRLRECSALVEVCTLKDNTAKFGGGISAWGSYDLIVQDCRFDSNSADFGGGAAFFDGGKASSALVQGCQIDGNSGGFAGGGISSDASLTVRASSFLRNATTFVGAAIASETVVEISDSHFIRNEVGGGFGPIVLIAQMEPTKISCCVFSEHRVEPEGSILGMVFFSSTALVVDQCTFACAARDEGVLIGHDGLVDFPHEFDVTLTNSIIWGRDVAAEDLIYVGDGSLTVTYSDIQGGFDGDGNIDADPLFVDDANGDLRLQEGSPCIDAGDPDSPPDRDGSVADIGAFPYILENFRRGDVDGSGATQALTDAIFLLEWGFLGGETPPCADAADIDDDGAVSPLRDAIYLLEWQFAGGEDPPAPGPEGCALDPTDDATGCNTPLECD